MRKLLFFCFLALGISTQAQTNFNSWDLFQSTRFGFTMKYPDQWEVNEESNGNFTFHNPYERLGTFRIIIDDRGDSAAAYQNLLRLEQDNNGGGILDYGSRKMVLFKTVIVQDNIQLEVHHWVILVENTLFRCSYTFDTALRNAPNMVEEMKLAYQTIDSLNFTNND